MSSGACARTQKIAITPDMSASIGLKKRASDSRPDADSQSRLAAFAPMARWQSMSAIRQSMRPIWCWGW